MMRPSRVALLVVSMFFGLLSSPARADKEIPAPLLEIRDTKARGERYLGMTWHPFGQRWAVVWSRGHRAPHI